GSVDPLNLGPEPVDHLARLLRDVHEVLGGGVADLRDIALDNVLGHDVLLSMLGLWPSEKFTSSRDRPATGRSRRDIAAPWSGRSAGCAPGRARSRWRGAAALSRSRVRDG